MERMNLFWIGVHVNKIKKNEWMKAVSHYFLRICHF